MTRGLVMTTLRLHRAQIVVTGVFLAVLVASAGLHGSVTAAFIDGRESQGCVRASCGALALEVAQRYQVGGVLIGYLALLPAAIGAFWGAPLLGREFETGTVGFAWTQSVTRRSWVLARIGTLGLLVAGAALAVGLVLNGWLSVFSGFDLTATTGELSFTELRGAGPVAWWLMGFAVGTFSGAVLRRTLPAMVVTVVFMVAATIARNLYLAAVSASQSVAGMQSLRAFETLILAAATAVLFAATTWVAGRARG